MPLRQNESACDCSARLPSHLQKYELFCNQQKKWVFNWPTFYTMSFSNCTHGLSSHAVSHLGSYDRGSEKIGASSEENGLSSEENGFGSEENAISSEEIGSSSEEIGIGSEKVRKNLRI